MIPLSFAMTGSASARKGGGVQPKQSAVLAAAAQQVLLPGKIDRLRVGQPLRRLHYVAIKRPAPPPNKNG